MGMWTPLSASLSAISPQGAPVRASQCSVLPQCSVLSHCSVLSQCSVLPSVLILLTPVLTALLAVLPRVLRLLM